MIFYRFYKIWPKPNKRVESIYKEVPGKFWFFIEIPLVFTNKPSGRRTLTTMPSTMAAGSPTARDGRR
jgi:hypothetical protein